MTMKTVKPKKPFVPAARQDTVRHEIIAVITDNARCAKDVSQAVRISEKEVYDHLEHIRKTIRITITPAVCRRCGFRFTKRDRLKKPGKCPVCNAEQIDDPLFVIES